MEIVIVRQEPKPWGIDGRLSIGRQYLCDTVEHPRHHLPEGDYIISSLGAIGSSLSVAAHSKGNLPSPFRHGDGALASLHGEIIVGKQLLPGVVTQSQATYNHLYERLKKAFQRGNTIRLRIVG
ncbi:MAG: hypothetical protein IJ920_08775 [Paludibacteraceae bacterium]|nr:hypothetical protein [Paludibacteraceae bacterium]